MEAKHGLRVEVEAAPAMRRAGAAAYLRKDMASGTLIENVLGQGARV